MIVVMVGAAAVFAALLHRDISARKATDPDPLEFLDVSATPGPLPSDRTSNFPSRAGRDRGDIEREGARLAVFVLVVSEDRRELANRAVGVRRRGTTGRATTFSNYHGEGRVLLEESDDVAAAVAAGEAEAFVRVPGRPDAVAPVDPAVDGAAHATVVAPLGVTAYLSITDAHGVLIRERSTLVAVSVGQRPPARFDVENGEAFIGGLEPGLPIRFQAIFGDREPREVTAILAGEFEKELRVSLAAVPLPSVLSGRIESLAGPGDPRHITPDDRVRITIGYGGASLADVFVGFSTIERDGQFRVAAPDGEDLYVEASIVGGGRPSVTAPSKGVRIPLLKRNEEVNLGTIHAVAEPVLADGFILTSDGRVADGALVWLVPSTASESGPSARYFAAAQADSAGHFELRGTTSGPFSVVAGLLAETTRLDREVSAPVHGLELTLAPAGRLAGSVENLPVPDYMSRPYVELRPRDGGPGAVTEINADGEFRADVAPGWYDVRFVVPGLAPKVIPDVEVRAGDVRYDPRLQKVVVASEFRTCRVIVTKKDVTDESRNRASGATVRAMFAESLRQRREPIVVVADGSGEVRFPYEVSGRPPALLVEYAEQRQVGSQALYFGYRPARVQTEDAVNVALVPGARIEFKPDVPVTSVSGDLHLGLLLVWKEATDGVRPELAEHRTITLAWPHGGIPVVGALPDGIWAINFVVEREGSGAFFKTFDMGTLTVRQPDTLVAVPLGVSRFLESIRGK